MTVSIHLVEWLILLAGIGAAMVPPTVFAADETSDANTSCAQLRDQAGDWPAASRAEPDGCTQAL